MQGSKLEQLALNIDIAPTILDMAGITIPDEMDGISLFPNLSGYQGHTRSDFFMEHVGIIDVENPIPDSRGVRSVDWKYIRYVNVEPEVEELYHLGDDPLESRNLSDDPNHLEVKNLLRERYDDYMGSLQK